MTHNEMLRDLLLKNDVVFIKDIRNTMNWRSRVADCRRKYGMDIRAVKVLQVWGPKLHGYKCFNKDAVVLDKKQECATI
jgi:hypothetical protein